MLPNNDQQTGDRVARDPETHSGFLRPGRILLLVAGVASLVRLFYVLEIHDHLYWLTPQIDAAGFHLQAMQVADGLGLGQRVFYKAPAYAWLVGQLYGIVGPSLIALYVVQMLGGVIASVAVAWLGIRWFGAWVGLLAGLLLALHVDLVYFENQALIEAPAVVVCVLAVVLFDRALCRGLPQGPRSLAWLLGAGVLLGLALQLRPINAFLVAGLMLWCLGQAWPWSARLRTAVFLLAPVLLLLIPTLRHNRQGSGELVPVSVNGGINFYIGNNPHYDDTVAIRPGLQWEALTRRFGGNDDPVQWQRNYYGESWKWIQNQPGDWLGLLVKKGVLFWNVRTIDRNQDSNVLRQESWMHRLSVPWGLLAWLGLLGLALSWRQARRLPLHVLVVAPMLGVLCFFVTTRYRLALVPWLALAAAFAVVFVVTRWRDHGPRSLWGPGLGLLLTGAFVLPDFHDIGSRRHARPDYDLARVQYRNGLHEEALASYRRAATQHPDDADVHLWYAQQLERQGHAEEALTHYRRAADLAPEVYKPALFLGAAYLEQGDLDAADAWFARAEQRGDRSGRSAYNRGLVRERQERYADALILHQRSLAEADEATDRAHSRLAVARCQLRLGRTAAALADLRAAAGMSAEESFQLQVVRLWIEAQRPAEALASLEGMRGTVAPAVWWFQQARALALRGDTQAALQAARQAAEADPANAAYRQLLERLEAATAP